MKTLKELVAPGKTATFVRFKGNELIYITDCGFEFPIPAEDITGEAELLQTERTMSLMKWIRKQLNMVQESLFDAYMDASQELQGHEYK